MSRTLDAPVIETRTSTSPVARRRLLDPLPLPPHLPHLLHDERSRPIRSHDRGRHAADWNGVGGRRPVRGDRGAVRRPGRRRHRSHAQPVEAVELEALARAGERSTDEARRSIRTEPVNEPPPTRGTLDRRECPGSVRQSFSAGRPASARHPFTIERPVRRYAPLIAFELSVQ